MTNEQMKAEAKKHFGLDITDEQAEAFAAKHSGEELSAEELENVMGGCGMWQDSVKYRCPRCNSTNVTVYYREQSASIFCKDCLTEYE